MFRKLFIKGLITLLPIILTFSLVLWLFGKLESFFGHWLGYLLPKGYYFPGMGIFAGFLSVLFVGALMHAWLVKLIYSWGEALLKKIPFIKTVYTAFSDAMRFLDQSENQESKPVLVRISNTKVIGFVMSSKDQLNSALLKADEVLIYVPFSYMVGGQLWVAAKEDVSELGWSWEKAMSFVLTAGISGKQ